MITKCKNCKGIFKKKIKKQIFCCNNCRSLYWFRNNRNKWNTYMRERSRVTRLDNYVKNLKDFEPKKEDYEDFYNF